MSTTTPATEGRKLPFYMAMVAAIRQEMARDSSVFCLGEDVGQIGGVVGGEAAFAEGEGGGEFAGQSLGEGKRFAVQIAG